MHKRSLIAILPAAMLLSGCGAGGGMGLSGGSLPTGGGKGILTGLAVLPNTQPLTSAAISVRVLATGQTVSTTSSIGTNGGFTVSGVPVATDVEVILAGSAGTTLRVIVPSTVLTTPSSMPVQIGTVDARTTVVAQATETEVAQAPENTPEIVSGQLGELNTTEQGEDQTENEQENEVTNNADLTTAANTLIEITANHEIDELVEIHDTVHVSETLDGLLADVQVQRGTSFSLTTAQGNSLIAAQQANALYSTAAVASALNAAGVSATAASVSAADQTQRTRLSNWNHLGTGITAFEALDIATTSPSSGGFQLSQTQINSFLAALLPG